MAKATEERAREVRRLRDAIKDQLRPSVEREIAQAEADGERRQARALRWALGELDEHDNPDPYKVMKHLTRWPVTIEEFCRSKEFVGALDDFQVWDGWQGELTRMNPDVMCGEDPVHEIVLGGASGTGKTTLAWINLAYQIYLLTCFDKPHAPFPSLASLMPIMFPMMSLKPAITKKVIYQPFRTLMLSMPYVQRELQWDKYKDSELAFSNGITVVPVLAMDTSMQGQGVPGALIDEIAFMDVIEASKQVPGPRGLGGLFDQAELVHNATINRRNRSFRTRAISIGTVCVLSNTRYQGDFMDRRLAALEKAEEPNVYHRRLKRYELNPPDVQACERGETIRVLVGTDSYPSKLLDEEERVPKTAHVEVIPAHYEQQVARDPDGAIREICGISTGVVRPFIPRRNKIRDAFERGEDLLGWVDQQDVDLTLRDLPEWVEDRMSGNKDALRFIHVDLSKSQDRCGVAVIRVLGYVFVPDPDNPEIMLEAPHYAVEVAVTIKPSGESQIDPFEIRTWLMQMGTLHGFQIGGVSYDGYQSMESVQRWKTAGTFARELSVDRTAEAYSYLRSALYQDRVDITPSEVLWSELLELEHDVQKDKVDHPPKGCFTGDTRVALMDGTLPTFEELAVRYPQGGEFAVYTMGAEGVRAGWAKNPRVTRRDAALVEVTLDNYQIVRCTPDHLFMLLDGTWVEAQHLTPQDCIMPLYRSRENKGGWAGYERVWCPVRRGRVMGHHLSAELRFGAIPDGYIVHHRDEVKHNNDPYNVELKERAEHARQHTTKRHATDSEYVRRLREGHARYRRDGGDEKSRQNMIKLHREGRMRPGRTSKQQNHRVLHVCTTAEVADVWDLTVDETHNFALASGVFVHNSKDLADAVAGAIFNASQTRGVRRAGGYVNSDGERARVRERGGRRDKARPGGSRKKGRGRKQSLNDRIHEWYREEED